MLIGNATSQIFSISASTFFAKSNNLALILTSFAKLYALIQAFLQFSNYLKYHP